MDERKTIWQRLRESYRVTVMNEKTRQECVQWHASQGQYILFIAATLLLSFGLAVLFIWITPLKNYMPGYNENLRQELVAQTYRLDSLQQQMDLQTAYFNSIRDVVSGNVLSDSVPSLDSLALLQREQLLVERSSLLDSFIADYEVREHDNLLLFDQTAAHPVTTLFRPVQGVITEPYDIKAGRSAIRVLSQVGVNVSATLTGTIVYENYIPSEGWMMMVQHDGDYLSMYYGLIKPFKPVGAGVQAGETLGLAADEYVRFELWQRGLPLNPEEVISF